MDATGSSLKQNVSTTDNERKICEQKHVGPLYCCENCGPSKVMVNKQLSCGHNVMVFTQREPDDLTVLNITKLQDVLPDCGHKVEILCYLDMDKIKCTEKCRHRLECGHACDRSCHVLDPDHTAYICTKECGKQKKGCTAQLDDGDLGEHECKKRCADECDSCNVLVTKVIPDCNHTIKVECKTVVKRELCNEPCSRTLSCGHACKQRCGATCDAAQCTRLTAALIPAPCGHSVQLPCNVYVDYNKKKIAPKDLLKYCKKPCNAELACSHICQGTCFECHQGRLHVPCKQTCYQINICGHQCQEPCNQICPPCNQICEVQCAHSRCRRICSEPCVPCKEKCNRCCPHGACTRRCYEACSCAPCDESCARALPCGHRCRGVCGEPCPDVCRVCRPEHFPTDFFGEEYGDDDKFILLQDCGHVLELENMDNLMMGDRDNIQIRQCPFCRKPIIDTNRYKDLVNNIFKNEVNPIKERINGKKTEILEKSKILENKIQSIYSNYREDNRDLSTSLKKFVAVFRSHKKINLLQLEMLILYCNILEKIIECWHAFKNAKITNLKNELEQNIALILQVLNVDCSKSKALPIKISEQQQTDIGNEIKRLNCIVQLAKLLELSKSFISDPSVRTQIDITKSLIFTLRTKFDEEKSVKSLEVLQMRMKSSDNVTIMQRPIIAKAMGRKAVEWYKCPNGHLYCASRCNGPIQVARCPECNALIGATNYVLMPGNSLADEMNRN